MSMGMHLEIVGPLAGGEVGATSGATRSLLDRIHVIGPCTAGRLEPATGVVHRDFHHRNVLWQGDDVAADIDWVRVGRDALDRFEGGAELRSPA
jgi:Phosphotransferase enzyme family